MKRIVFILALTLSLSAFSQSTIKIKDTTFSFSAAHHSATVMQSDYSVDSYKVEIQNNKLVVIYENDESNYSLKGYVFLIKSLDKEAFKKSGYVRTGAGLVLKGQARTFDNNRASANYEETEFTIAFNTEENKNAYVEKLLKVK
jgi:hypothetical protein